MGDDLFCSLIPPTSIARCRHAGCGTLSTSHITSRLSLSMCLSHSTCGGHALETNFNERRIGTGTIQLHINTWQSYTRVQQWCLYYRYQYVSCYLERTSKRFVAASCERYDVVAYVSRCKSRFGIVTEHRSVRKASVK